MTQTVKMNELFSLFLFLFICKGNWELISMTAIFSIVLVILIARRNMNEDNSVGMPVAFNDTLKSFGNEFLLMTSQKRPFFYSTGT